MSALHACVSQTHINLPSRAETAYSSAAVRQAEAANPIPMNPWASKCVKRSGDHKRRKNRFELVASLQRQFHGVEINQIQPQKIIERDKCDGHKREQSRMSRAELADPGINDR